ncbi:hypothetical protein F8388_023395 [Cannabis sativa]|uniref:Uncharacterized protein n=1 Tax=Cannabis sativa TaxID=3483 RepID=A0A7J6HFA5_CANSA|nr:hypothetical protein F8388_023395 [Cannabis sativa]
MRTDVHRKHFVVQQNVRISSRNQRPRKQIDLPESGCIQRQMARILTLDFQLHCLDYEAENWYHADLDFETFKLLQMEKGESFFSFARDMTLKSTKAMIDIVIARAKGVCGYC